MREERAEQYQRFLALRGDIDESGPRVLLLEICKPLPSALDNDIVLPNGAIKLRSRGVCEHGLRLRVSVHSVTGSLALKCPLSVFRHPDGGRGDLVRGALAGVGAAAAGEAADDPHAHVRLAGDLATEPDAGE